MERVARTAKRWGVTVLAVGLGTLELRLVLQAGANSVEGMVRGLKIGCTRSLRRSIGFDSGSHGVHEIPPGGLTEAIAWCHTPIPVDDPLAWPWSSHRDLMGYRQARFYDAAVLRHRVSPERVHALAGGGPLPRADMRVERAGLDALLQVAAAVIGREVADPRSFGVFVQLAKQVGYATGELAQALNLTARRVRQLAQRPHPMTDTAALYLVDTRLMV